MQSVQRGACPRRHPELGRKRAGLLIQGNGAGCIVFLQKQCAGQIIARLRPEVALSLIHIFRIGGLANLSMGKVAPAAWVILLCLGAALALANEMDVLALGADTARSLGLSLIHILFCGIPVYLKGAPNT